VPAEAANLAGPATTERASPVRDAKKGRASVRSQILPQRAAVVREAHVCQPPYQAADPPDMAINAGLRALGIQTAGLHDEFAAIGLDKHRWTNDWATG
jgi:hypothetical protein